MSQNRYACTLVALRRARLAGLLAAVCAVVLTGCGSGSPTKTRAGQPAATASQPLASAPAPAHKPRPRVARVHRSGSTGSTSSTATKPASGTSTTCPAGQKRTATGLCYSPAAQKALVTKLGPCAIGQVVATNGACQPLTSGSSLPARCRRPHRANCVPEGSLQGGGLKVARSPGFDTVFH